MGAYGLRCRQGSLESAFASRHQDHRYAAPSKVEKNFHQGTLLIDLPGMRM